MCPAANAATNQDIRVCPLPCSLSEQSNPTPLLPRNGRPGPLAVLQPWRAKQPNYALRAEGGLSTTGLTLFGLVAVSGMLVTCALEDRGPWLAIGETNRISAAATVSDCDVRAQSQRGRKLLMPALRQTADAFVGRRLWTPMRANPKEPPAPETSSANGSASTSKVDELNERGRPSVLVDRGASAPNARSSLSAGTVGEAAPEHGAEARAAHGGRPVDRTQSARRMCHEKEDCARASPQG